jgi:hypothetical protein
LLYGGTSLMTGAYSFPASGTNQQLATGTGPALVGVPMKAWQREVRHG